MQVTQNFSEASALLEGQKVAADEKSDLLAVSN